MWLGIFNVCSFLCSILALLDRGVWHFLLSRLNWSGSGRNLGASGRSLMLPMPAVRASKVGFAVRAGLKSARG